MPTAARAVLAPFTLLLFGLSTLVICPLIVAAGFFLFTVLGIGGSYWTIYFPAVVALVLGMATTIAPLAAVFLGVVEGRYAVISSGMNNAVARGAGLLYIAVLSTFLLRAARCITTCYRASVCGYLSPGYVDCGWYRIGKRIVRLFAG